jgi:hypothetical protein
MRVCLLFLFFFAFACSGTSVPGGVLPPEKMETVLYDVIRADEMVDFLKLSDSTWQPFSRRTALYDTVFQLHGVKKEEFQKSLSYYQQRPDILKEIIEGMQKKAKDTTSQAKQRMQLEQRLPAE